MAGEISIHVGGSYLDALALTVTQARDLFESKAFGNLRKSLEAKQKMNLAIIGRIDNVSKGIGGLGKLLASFAKIRR